MIGTVKWFNATKGYGFIAPEDGGKDSFLHISALERAGLTHVSEGQRLEYDLESGRDGKTSCANVRVVD
ncbi:MAG: cold-shock protein [Proteobacteria bacterium]|nr:cold-shock protein [Pseudomonadota bacterium]MDA1057788.1 cold-shock protein [Pseudomonadota bacterium]